MLKDWLNLQHLYEADGKILKERQPEPQGAPSALILIKPEIQALPYPIWSVVLETVFEQLSAAGQIVSMSAFSGRTAKARRLVERNWFVLNTWSQHASELANGRLKSKLHELAAGRSIIGGHEVEREIGLSIDEIERLVRNAETVKVGAGLYVTNIQFAGRQYSVVNGFHPMQQQRFCDDSAKWVAIEFECEVPLRDLRHKYIGIHSPELCAGDALKGRVHRYLRESGLPGLSLALNGFHCSPNWLDASLGCEAIWGSRPKIHDLAGRDLLSIVDSSLWSDIEDEEWDPAREILDYYLSEY